MYVVATGKTKSEMAEPQVEQQTSPESHCFKHKTAVDVCVRCGRKRQGNLQVMCQVSVRQIPSPQLPCFSKSAVIS